MRRETIALGEKRKRALGTRQLRYARFPAANRGVRDETYESRRPPRDDRGIGVLAFGKEMICETVKFLCSVTTPSVGLRPTEDGYRSILLLHIRPSRSCSVNRHLD